MAEQLLHDDLAGRAGTDDEDPSGRLEPAPLGPAAEQPDEESGQGDRARAETGVDEEDR